MSNCHTYIFYGRQKKDNSIIINPEKNSRIIPNTLNTTNILRWWLFSLNFRCSLSTLLRLVVVVVIASIVNTFIQLIQLIIACWIECFCFFLLHFLLPFFNQPTLKKTVIIINIMQANCNCHIAKHNSILGVIWMSSWIFLLLLLLMFECCYRQNKISITLVIAILFIIIFTLIKMFSLFKW